MASSSGPAMSEWGRSRKPGILDRILNKKPDFNDSRLLLLIGNTLCGKTTIVKQYIYDTMRGAKRRYKKVYLLCPTHELSNTYDLLPDEWKHKDFELVGFYKRLCEIQWRKRDVSVSKEVPEKERILLILDDCVGEISSRDGTLDLIASKCRHYKIDVIIVCHHMAGLANPMIRSASSYTIFGQMQDTNREKVIKIVSTYGTKPAATEYVNRAFGDPYRFIVLSNNPKDQIPLYTVKLDLKLQPKSFRIKIQERRDRDLEQLEEL